ncbi:hypothetical protein [Paenibacillus larvae]|uniref:Uncharacterized protein n=1 Tax=Paenibacillus larvae subsp. larvae TaxID=147375 RepID=A0A2L1U7H2_9BACL|nr:hypothetical protein [Paenibacillus larvae]AVF28876.1 hypothetical protein ERICIII_04874 [Paenibacillus larvae subsp. larvae]MCY9502437.1 hypothetical protein [Paenibacillus larvae]MDR5608771.1 hypothetical protein [Paenibacillus larvae]
MTLIRKIRIEKDKSGNPYIYYAWDHDENRVITPDSTTRPEIFVENGMVIKILPQNGDIEVEIPDFDPFPASDTLHFFNKKTRTR